MTILLLNIEKHKLNSHAHHDCPLTSLSLSVSFSQYHQAMQQSLQMQQQQQHMLQQQMMMQQPIYQSQQQQQAHYTALVRRLIHLER